MRRFENGSASSNDDRELSITKLAQITGIARKTAQAMYEIGIHSFADLIAYLSQHTAEEFSAALKEHGVNRRPGLIDREMWIKQAEMLSQLEKTTPTLPKGEAEPEEKPKESPSGREPREHDAVFTVSFDIAKDDAGELVLSITVYNESNGGEEAIFQGTDAAPWVNWILERANLPFIMKPITSQIEVSEEPPPVEAQAAVQRTPGEQYDVLLEISDVQLSVIGPTLRQPEKRLKAAIDIKLSGSDAERLTLQSIPFRTEIYTIELHNGFPRHVWSREDQFKPHMFRYSYKLEFAMPVVGRYEFHSLVRLLPSGELRAYHRGPTMRVTP